MPPPYGHIVFETTTSPLTVTVAEWQAWNDRKGWGDM